ncbi:MAG: TraM recognition domain-containing protein [Clostridia bacterium]|nr:TraM recognition domain-containing protein [Clostridia bacterium]
MKNGLLQEKDIYNLLSCVNFFDKEFFSLDERTLSILKSEISRITNIFVSDYNVSKTFCPKREEINFKGFEEALDEGKIVVLNMNIAEYKNLSKIIAAYLKLDFQGTVLNRLSNGKQKRKSAFISDEYHEYVTTTDADFFAQSREAKCINIIATQSYTSLQNSLKDEANVKVIIQSLINKFWFRTDDNFTIEEIQKLIGKEEKERISTTISENAKQTDYSLFKRKLVSRDTNISESYNKYLEKDFIYDTRFFSQELETFTSLAFLSSGSHILTPQKLKMIPYFQKTKTTKNNNLKGFDLNE